jgi:hypothetical protein
MNTFNKLDYKVKNGIKERWLKQVILRR